MTQRRGWLLAAGLVFVCACTGPRGDKGDPGPTGLEGNSGGAGAAGDKGPPGADGLVYARTLVVSPASTEEESGKALRAAVAAATPSAEAPWRILLEPGTYALGSSTLDVKAHLTLEGSGRRVTRLTTVQDGNGIVLRAGAALRELDVDAPHESFSGNRVLVCSGGPVTLQNVGVSQRAGGKDGLGLGTVECLSGVDAEDVSITVAAAAGSARALLAGGPVRLERVVVEVAAPQGAGGIHVTGTANIRDLVATVESQSGNATALQSGAVLTLADSQLGARGSSSTALVANGQTVVERSTLDAVGTALSVGVNTSVEVQASRFIGGTPLVAALSGATVRLVQTQLAGGSVMATCFACFDEAFTNTVGVDKCP